MKRWMTGISVFLAVSSLGLAGRPAFAQVLYFVDNTNDSGPGSLRQAILNANATPGADGIDFSLDFSVPRTILLTSGPLVITDSLDLFGPGASLLSIDGSNPFVDGVLVIPAGVVSVTIDRLSIVNGGGSFGGGIDNRGNLTVTNCAFLRNHSRKGGGGIFNGSGNLTVNGTVFSSNEGEHSGGVWNLDGNLTVSDSSLDANAGFVAGGLENGSGILTVDRCAFTGNRSKGGLGGGIANSSGPTSLSNCSITGSDGARLGGGLSNRSGVVVVTRSVISGNDALEKGGGIFHQSGTLTVIDSTIAGNNGAFTGGGIYNETGAVTVENSTISGNFIRKGHGGGIGNLLGTVTVRNSTVSGNRADGDGGGIYNDPDNNTGDVAVRNTTIARNAALRGGGFFGRLSIMNSIVAGNAARLIGGDCGDRAFLSLGHNIAGDDSCRPSYTAPGDRNSIDPILGPLQDNGGPTWTHALLPGSPAIDTGDNIEAPATDQRGLPRLQDGDGNGSAIVDIGSFEAPTYVPPPPECFDFTVPGRADSKLRLCQGSPPILHFDLIGFHPPGHRRTGATPIPTLAGAGTILQVQVIGRQVVVITRNGTYVSREGFLYIRLLRFPVKRVTVADPPRSPRHRLRGASCRSDRWPARR